MMSISFDGVYTAEMERVHLAVSTRASRPALLTTGQKRHRRLSWCRSEGTGAVS